MKIRRKSDPNPRYVIEAKRMLPNGKRSVKTITIEETTDKKLLKFVKSTLARHVADIPITEKPQSTMVSTYVIKGKRRSYVASFTVYGVLPYQIIKILTDAIIEAN